MKIEIKHRYDNSVLFSIEIGSMKLAVEAAIAAKINLRSADLRSADLSYAVNLALPTGETWVEYLTETLPALLVAGGKTLESFADSWKCHEWQNCPMAHAFDVHDLKDVPILLRPRAEQFVQFFDAHQIPWPLPTKEELLAQAEALQCAEVGEQS